MPRPRHRHQQKTLQCDDLAFRNYPGVEDHGATELEMQSRLDKGHLVAFDTYQDLADFSIQEFTASV